MLGEWVKNGSWWDYMVQGRIKGAYGEVIKGQWWLIWPNGETVLPPSDYTEEQVRAYIETKYILERGES